MKPFDAILLNKAIKGGGVTPSGSISISANGTYDVSAFAEAVVNVGGSDRLDNLIQGSSFALYDTFTSLASGAFMFDSYITSIEMPNCTSIGYSALYQAANLSMASFPAATYVHSQAFYSCAKLKSVYLPNAVTLRNSVFCYCSSLTTLVLPKVTAAGNFCFTNCTALVEISLPAYSSFAGMQMFSNCYNLETVYLGNITEIGASTFARCYHLLSLYLPGSFCQLLYTNAFGSTPISGYTTSTSGVYGSIFVPASLVDTYKAATNWSAYADRITAIV